MRSRRKPFPLFSILTTSIWPIWLVDAHVRAPVGLLVQADDVHDPDVGHVVRDEVRRGADDVRDRQRVIAGQRPDVDPPAGGDLGVAGGLDRFLEAPGQLGQVKVHASDERLHVAAGHQRAVVAEHDTAQHVQAGVGPHQRGAPLVLDRAPDRGSRRRHRVASAGIRYSSSPLLHPLDPGLHPAPEQHAVVGRLTAAAGVERRAVEHDPVLAGVEDGRVPLAQGLVVKLEPVRAPGSSAMAPVGAHVGHRRRAAAPPKSSYLGPDVGEVDGRGHERDHGQDADTTEKLPTGGGVKADRRGHAGDDQPQRLGLLAGRDEAPAWAGGSRRRTRSPRTRARRWPAPRRTSRATESAAG